MTTLQAFRRLYEQVGLCWVYAITKYEPVSFFVPNFTCSLIKMLPFSRCIGLWIMPVLFVIICSKYNNMHLRDYNNN